MANELPIHIHDEVENVLGTPTNPLRMDPTGATPQPVSGTVTVTGTTGNTIADGADVNAGATSDAAVTTDANATLSAKLRGLVKILGNVWDSVNGRLKVDGSGVTQPVSGTVAATQGTSPWVTDQQNLADLDYDTGAGTVTQAVVGIALPAAGGPVAGGTATDPLRIDPTGATSQPVADGGGSLTVDTPQLPSALVGGRLDVVVGAALPAGTNNIGDVDLASAIPAGDNAIGRVKITDGTDVASVRDLTNSDPLDVAIVDAAGDQITSFGGGTQYTDGDTDATPTGTAVVWRDAADAMRVASVAKPLPAQLSDGTRTASVRDTGSSDSLNVSIVDASGNQITSFGGGTPNTVSTNNSSTATLGVGGVFTGTGETVLAYAAVTVSIRASHAAAADGVSIEWSNDNSNWDRTEKWDYVADKPFSVCLRPKGEFFRVVYTNGGTGQTTFRLETILHGTAPRDEGFVESGRVLVDGVSYKIKWIKINATASGDNTIISSVSGKKLRVIHLHFTCGNNVTIAFKSGSNTLIDAEDFAKFGGISDNSQAAGFFLETNAGEAFIMNLSGTVNVRGRCYYIEI